MDYTPEKIADIEAGLRTLELISDGEHVTEAVKGDYWEKLLCFYSQVRGEYYFTADKIMFAGGFAGSTNWAVKFKDIKKIEKCSVGLFMPFGVRMHFYDEKKDKVRSYKLSLLKRETWIDYLTQKAGL